ncbi:MAG: RnfABCDGE type electron transport complex subunit G [Bacteroidales bacterium]|nr:RnfABCDGE type electron transport complex subunit G [Bacteroidales bacterium]MBR4690897.1 RnfABCDGE type electron transport complex subunit G [Bacteroidales bacterium]
MESSLKNMVISLLVITLVAGLSLGFVQQVTKDPIANSKQQKQIEAISAVVPAFNNNPLETCEKVAVDDDSLAVYTAQNGDEIVGYAILSSTNSGFGGNVQIMVGFNPDGTIYNTSVVTHQETPGLGDQMTTEKFRSQFIGFDCKTKKARVKKDGGDVDALTAATISSRAFCSAINKAYRAFCVVTKDESGHDAESGATKHNN